jgi:hypothetical protein
MRRGRAGLSSGRLRAWVALGVAGAVAVAVPALAGSAATRGLSWQGVRLEVPEQWQVVDFATDPAACLRLDRPTLYLGTPGPDQDCPAHLVGRAPTVQAVVGDVTPTVAAGETALVRRLGGVTLVGRGGADLGPVSGILAAAQSSLAGAEAGVEAGAAGAVTAVRGPADSATAGLGLPPLPLPPLPLPGQPAPPPPGTPASVVQGEGFDTCTVPSTAAMQAWQASPYRTIGIYVGGINRACGDGNLSAGWIQTVRGQGWSMVPIYVGRQAPCAGQSGLAPIDPSQAQSQGVAAADDAIANLNRFGFRQGAVVYFDMENYAPSCRGTVLTFLAGWTDRLHQQGYRSGAYGSVASLGRDLVGVAGSYPEPDVLWFAHWDGRHTVWGDPYIPDSAFTHHQRLHQYSGDSRQTWGGVTINIDGDYLDGLAQR